MSDLLSQGLGSKSSQGAEKSSNPPPSPNKTLVGHNEHDTRQPGDDLMAGASKKEAAPKAETTSDSVKESSKQTETSKKETSADTDSSTWTLENALKEMKKTREEAKTTRIK